MFINSHFAEQHRSSSIRSKQVGATLIEVLVTFLLLSFGVLAMGSLQAFSVASTMNSANRAIAAAIALEFAEMIRANPQGLANGRYDIAANSSNFYTSAAVSPLTTGQTCVYPNCTEQSLGAMELATIGIRARAALKYGAVVLNRPTVGSVQSTTQADLWVAWAEGNAYTDRIAGESFEKDNDNCPAALRTLNPLPRCFYMRVTL